MTLKLYVLCLYFYKHLELGSVSDLTSHKHLERGRVQDVYDSSSSDVSHFILDNRLMSRGKGVFRNFYHSRNCSNLSHLKLGPTPNLILLRQYLYFCTCKARKLSTPASGRISLMHDTTTRFVLVNQVNWVPGSGRLGSLSGMSPLHATWSPWLLLYCCFTAALLLLYCCFGIWAQAWHHYTPLGLPHPPLPF